MSPLNFVAAISAFAILFFVGKYIYNSGSRTYIVTEPEPELDETEDIYHQTETFSELRRMQPISEN